ncbi:hypothetical protein BZARG_1455 [Bizionia argentinensis JUB59]|uniref:DUF4412 domain-containing protein n=1 Tax=Bizionia argentinensis JUB59 TaxID=1046627 RepID=G2EC31_9FLAO|nr:DUF6263 family protein [Bizionia argentinensis]EGV43974.1 hypothetical protein BZARG_1455 [Bizionia argentinensis JUB59]
MHKNLTTILLLFTALSNVIQAQTQLQYNLKTGDSIHVHQKANQLITQDSDETTHEMTNILESTFVFTVKTVTDSSYILDFSYKHFKLESTSNLYGVMISVDTAAPIEESDMEGQIFKGLTKAKLKVEFLKSGDIISIRGTTRMINNMMEGVGIEDEFTKQIMIEEMKKEFGSKSLSDSFEQFTYIYPTKKVAIGDSWKNTYSGDIAAENTWVLTSTNPNISLIGSANITLHTEEDNYNMILEGIKKTNVSADKKSGFVKTMTVTSKTQGNAVSLQNNSVKIPTTINSNTTYKTKLYVQ